MMGKGNNLLLISTNEEEYNLIKTCLRGQRYKLSHSNSEAETMEKMNDHGLDLILLDITDTQFNGYKLCQKIHLIPEYREIPILFLTSHMDKRSIMKGFKAGAVDYILKPFKQAEVLVRVRTHLELKNYREKLEQINVDLNKEILRGIQMEDELRSSKEELEKVNRQLYEKATKDVLTGLFNRRKMMDFIEYEIERSTRNKKPFSIILTDIDHFKMVNDTYGHDCGDVVLRIIGQTFLSAIRKQDHVSRWGGEEFMFLLPETDENGSFTLAEKIRHIIAKKQFQCNKENLSDITMTFGIAVFQDHPNVDTLIKHADLALYHGKNTGRNRTVLYTAELSE
ncbi:MAG: GGDEF domain-containing response regulator [Sediminispirochaetaceae bacterium]